MRIKTKTTIFFVGLLLLIGLTGFTYWNNTTEKENKSQLELAIDDNLLGVRSRTRNWVFSIVSNAAFLGEVIFQAPVDFEETITATDINVNTITFTEEGALNNLLEIDAVSTTTLEGSLSIGGQISGTSLTNSVINADIIGDLQLAPEIDYTGALNILGTLLLNGDSGGNGEVLTSNGNGEPFWDVPALPDSTLNGLEANQFLRSDTSDAFTSGVLSFNAGTYLNLSEINHNTTAVQGLRLPQNTSLSNPSAGEGFLAWNSSLNRLLVYDGTNWVGVDDNGAASLQTAYTWGNSIVLSNTFGDISFRNATNNILYVTEDTGFIGIGNSSPTQLLSIGSAGQTTIDATGNLEISDGGLVDLSAVTHANTNSQGLKLPTTNGSFGPAGNDGYIAWDSVNDRVVTWDGSTWGDVSGASTTLQEAYAAGNTIQLSAGDEDLRIFNDGGDEMLFFDESTGYLGIGTTSPAYTLDVNGDIRIASGSDLYIGTIGLQDTATPTTSGAYLIGVNDEFDYSNNTNVQGVLNDLDIALDTLTGLSHPAASLTTNGFSFLNLNPTTQAFTLSAVNLTSGTDISGILGVSNGGTGVNTFTTNGVIYGNGSSALQATSGPTPGQLLIGLGTSAPGFVTMSGDATIDENGVISLTNSYDSPLTFSNGLTRAINTITLGGAITQDTRLYDASNEYLFLDVSNGNLGIGTTSPGAKVEIEGSADIQQLIVQGHSAQTNNIQEWQNSSGTPLSGVTADGRLWIGNTSPYDYFRVNATNTTTAADSIYGGNIALFINPSTTSAALPKALQVTARTYQGNGEDYTGTFYGLYSSVYHLGTGTLSEAQASNFRIQNSSTGTISTAHSILVEDATVNGGGDITALAGITLDNQSKGLSNTNFLIGTTTIPEGNFSIYNSSTYDNYFAGFIGIGTTSPDAELEVVSTQATAPRGIISTQYASSQSGPNITFQKARGTENAPSATLLNDVIGNLQFAGFDGSIFSSTGGISAQIRGYATEDWTSTAHGNALVFETVENGTLTRGERLRINHDGNIGIGTTNPSEPIHIYEGSASQVGYRVDNTIGNWTYGINTSGTAIITQSGTGGAEFGLTTNGISYTSAAVTIGNGITLRSSGVSSFNGGNLGIGTTNPTTALSIVGSSNTTANVTVGGQVLIADGSTGAPGLALASNPDTGLQMSGSVMRLITDGSIRIALSSSHAQYIVPIRGVSGSTAAAPAYAFDDDSNTGLFLISDGVLGISSNGSERIRINNATVPTIDITGSLEFTMVTTGDTTIGVCKDNADGTGDNTELRECSGTPSDIAEYYAAVAGLKPGDVVELDYINDTPTLVKAKSLYSSKSLGVVSTYGVGQFGKPLGHSSIPTNQNPTAIGLSGKVPVVVSNSNGNIQAGDPITTSDIPGVAVKATSAGKIIGYALEPFDGSTRVSSGVRQQENYREENEVKFNAEPVDPTAEGQGKILLFINLSWNQPNITESLDFQAQVDSAIKAVLGLSDDQLAGLAEITLPDNVALEELISEKALEVMQEIFANGNITIGGDLVINGTVTADKIKTKELEFTDNKFIGSGKIEEGEDSVKIDLSDIKESSKVFITPKTNLEDASLYVKKIEENEYFEVGLTKELDKDVKFDWWVIQFDEEEEDAGEIVENTPEEEVVEEENPVVEDLNTVTEEEVLE